MPFRGHDIGPTLRLGCAQEYFHDYIHRRLRTIHSPDRRPDNTHGVDAGVDVEQGQDDEEDDDVVASSAFEKQSTTGKLVTPYADIGPITTLAAERCQHRDTGERVSASMIDCQRTISTTKYRVSLLASTIISVLSFNYHICRVGQMTSQGYPSRQTTAS